jgi:DNA repair protein RAD5
MHQEHHSRSQLKFLLPIIAINIYFDGSWKDHEPLVPSSSGRPCIDPKPSPLPSSSSASSRPQRPHVYRPRHTPEQRYLGAFGVTGWATRSGKLLSYGERVRIERSKLTNAGNKFGRVNKQAQLKADIVVRFTNSRDQEVGRLENESAAWISSLLDQKICVLEGSVVFAPEKLRTNDSIFLQIRCYALRSAFDSSGFSRLDSNRKTGLFEASESQEEKDLRLRQVALVKLLLEINLGPSRSNSLNAKQQREGLLQAAEHAEQQSGKASSVESKTLSGNGEESSSPSGEAEDGEELEQDQLDSLYKKAQSFDFDTPEAQPANTFTLDLRKYQKQALYWMMGKETGQKSDHKEQSMHPLWEEYRWPVKDVDDKDLPTVEGQDCFYVNLYSGEISLEFPVQEQNCQGGVLADEMGLGKTIEMLSLIHSHKADGLPAEPSKIVSTKDLPRLASSSCAVEWAPSTTLVVAPMSLLAQWQSEAEKASKQSTINAFVYYGSERNIDLRALCCEAHSSQVPNVIITSYGTILSEYNRVASLGGFRGSHGGLFSLEYFRVILDEAHFIKNRLSKTAKACYEIRARHRWVLTGTPIVNKLEDLFSLVHFLKVEPWSNFSYWKTFITVPFEAKEFIRALDVVQTVLEPLVLRRTKDMKTPDGQALVPLPPRSILIEEIELSKSERSVYDFFFNRAKRTFADNIAAGTLMKSYTTIFAQILRLRQSCCHPLLTRNKDIVADEEDVAAAADLETGFSDDMDLQSLLNKFESESAEQDANKFGSTVLKQIQDGAAEECPICSEEPMIEQAVTGCWHSACKQCLGDYIEHQRDKGEIPKCFNCREPINGRDVFEVIRHDPIDVEPGAIAFTAAQPSTPKVSLRRVGVDASAKISSLLRHLRRLRVEDPTLKSVVFSQFTSFLDQIEPALKRDNISFVRLDGTMAQKTRAAVIEDFVKRRKSVLLLSLRAGGVGLNLTIARRVFMMDPWWSFAVEAQAIDRVHRMGQEGAVTVIRFIVNESIEQKMLKIQDRKKFL